MDPITGDCGVEKEMIGCRTMPDRMPMPSKHPENSDLFWLVMEHLFTVQICHHVIITC